MTTHHDDGHDCRCTVPLEELGGTLGAGPTLMRALLREFGLEQAITADWAGRPALPLDRAGEFATAFRGQQREKAAIL